MDTGSSCPGPIGFSSRGAGSSDPALLSPLGTAVGRIGNSCSDISSESPSALPSTSDVVSGVSLLISLCSRDTRLARRLRRLTSRSKMTKRRTPSKIRDKRGLPATKSTTPDISHLSPLTHVFQKTAKLCRIPPELVHGPRAAGLAHQCALSVGAPSDRPSERTRPGSTQTASPRCLAAARHHREQ